MLVIDSDFVPPPGLDCTALFARHQLRGRTPLLDAVESIGAQHGVKPVHRFLDRVFVIWRINIPPLGSTSGAFVRRQTTRATKHREMFKEVNTLCCLCNTLCCLCDRFSMFAANLNIGGACALRRAQYVDGLALCRGCDPCLSL